LAPRPSAARRGYDGRWRAYRLAFLSSNPWCDYHLRRGRRIRATVVDHRLPHRGDRRLFWDPANHQALCRECHDRLKHVEEHSGYRPGCDVHGVPVDPNHHWNGATQ
jgi:5-methylcytosine-specific restriction endonuclease McrA